MVYLDYNATTPLAPEAREAMRPFLEDGFGNPSSIHSAGRRARASQTAWNALWASLAALPLFALVALAGRPLLALFGLQPDIERLALEYAERITYTDRKVDDALVADLKSHYSDAQIVELTAAIAMENFRSKFNPALGIEAQGFCMVPKRG